MSASDRISLVVAAATVVGCLACGDSGVDPKKFDAVDAAAQSLRADVHAHSGAGSARFAELLEALQTQIAAVESRVSGRQEKALLKAYAEAAEAYKYFLRFRDLDRDAVGGMVLLRGANRPVALRFGIPFEERGGGRWVNRKTAMDIFAAKADAGLANTVRLRSGRSP